MNLNCLPPIGIEIQMKFYFTFERHKFSILFILLFIIRHLNSINTLPFRFSATQKFSKKKKKIKQLAFGRFYCLNNLIYSILNDGIEQLC